MRETKFTPKPWRNEAPEIAGQIDNCYRTISAGCGYGKDEKGFMLTGYISEENASLMVVAPDLYDELEKSVEQMLIGLTAIQKLLEKCGDADVLHESEKTLMAQIESANSALSKARGEQ